MVSKIIDHQIVATGTDLHKEQLLGHQIVEYYIEAGPTSNTDQFG